MGRNKFSWIVYVIISLALVGLVYQLLTNTVGLFKNLFIMVAVGSIVFAAIYFIFLKKRAPSDDMKKYKQAVKQSKLKYNQNTETSTFKNRNRQTTLRRRLSRRRAPHLRVIQGTKPKEKDRTTF